MLDIYNLSNAYLQLVLGCCVDSKKHLHTPLIVKQLMEMQLVWNGENCCFGHLTFLHWKTFLVENGTCWSSPLLLWPLKSFHDPCHPTTVTRSCGTYFKQSPTISRIHIPAYSMPFSWHTSQAGFVTVHIWWHDWDPKMCLLLCLSSEAFCSCHRDLIGLSKKHSSTLLLVQ